VAAATLTVSTRPAFAGKMNVLEGFVRAAIEEAKSGAKTGARLAEDTRLIRGGEELFEKAAKQHDLLVRTAALVPELDDPALARRITQLSRSDSEITKTLTQMSAAERRFVVEAAETAGTISRRFPAEAAEMVTRLGPEGLSYTRVFGPQVAEVVLREGPEVLGVIRKGGRSAWEFFTNTVLPNKKKLVAAGVFAAFLANPDKFVDLAGRATDYAVREFARAGVELASVLPGSMAGGIDAGVHRVLERWGLNYAPVRYSAVALLLAIAATAVIRLFGWPIRTVLKPFTFAVRRLRGLT
jgi:hypothetical protein